MNPPFATVIPLSEATPVVLTIAIQIVFHCYVVVVVTVANPLREAVAVDLAKAIKTAVLICVRS